MPVNPISTLPYHPVPPEGPHTVTVHVPKWQDCMRLRDGDPDLLDQMKFIYPRFCPIGPTKELCLGIQKILGLSQDAAVLIFVAPDAVVYASEHGTSEHHKEYMLYHRELSYNAVKIDGTLLYVVSYPARKSPAMVGAWQDPGLIISTRLANSLLPHIKDLVEVPWQGGVAAIPPPTWLPQCSAHQALKERICSLMNRATIQPNGPSTKPEDVFLYQSGMAAIYRTYQASMERKPGTILVLGAVNHNTFHLLRGSKHHFKHFGQMDGQNDELTKVESWLDSEVRAGRAVSMCFLEFPCNPLLVSVDLNKLRVMADKYDFVLVVDETIGSFCNLDVTPAADIVVTSLTKTFSGYADVMAGSAVISAYSPSYITLTAIFKSRFHNELFSLDAAQLLQNNADYLTRSAVLNANAAALASYLHSQVVGPSSPVIAVLYPPYSQTSANFTAFQRRPTPDFTPGHGCLLSVDFATQETAVAFFDNLHFHGGPHLGAHRTLAIPFNATVWGSEFDEYPYHTAYGLHETQIRISVGLEETRELLEVVREACWCSSQMTR